MPSSILRSASPRMYDGTWLPVFRLCRSIPLAICVIVIEYELQILAIRVNRHARAIYNSIPAAAVSSRYEARAREVLPSENKFTIRELYSLIAVAIPAVWAGKAAHFGRIVDPGNRRIGSRIIAGRRAEAIDKTEVSGFDAVLLSEEIAHARAGYELLPGNDRADEQADDDKHDRELEQSQTRL